MAWLRVRSGVFVYTLLVQHLSVIFDPSASRYLNVEWFRECSQTMNCICFLATNRTHLSRHLSDSEMGNLHCKSTDIAYFYSYYYLTLFYSTY
jgi:hypothetical protein